MLRSLITLSGIPPPLDAPERGAGREGRPAVDGLDLKVEAGSIFGFLGRNGAGKTTTIRLLLGFLRSDGGDARSTPAADWTSHVRHPSPAALAPLLTLDEHHLGPAGLAQMVENRRTDYAAADDRDSRMRFHYRICSRKARVRSFCGALKSCAGGPSSTISP